MPALTQSNRAPAKNPISGMSRLLSAAIASRFWPCVPCRHRHVTLPFNGVQNCIDCGRSRRYLHATDFAHANAGTSIGPWRRAVAEQSSSEVVARTLMANALAGKAVRG